MKINTNINDKFIVKIVEEDFFLNYEKSLIGLYQPILGGKAISLYNTLKNIKKLSISKYILYFDILNLTKLNKTELIESFRKLEAINLITTYEYFNNEEMIYIHEINAPLKAEMFLQDKTLLKILSYYLDEEEITKFFNNSNNSEKKIERSKSNNALLKDVFYDELINSCNKKNSQCIKSKKDKDNINEIVEKLNKKKFGDNLSYIFFYKQFICKQIELYNISLEKVVEILLDLKNISNKEIFYEKLKINFHNYLLLECNKKNNINSSKVINQIKETKPEIYVKKILSSFTPQDLKNINFLRRKYFLTNEIINTLYNYVFHTYNTSNFSLIEKIADTWYKKNIDTFEKAINFLKENRNNKKKYKDKHNVSKLRKYRKENKEIEDVLSTEEEKKLMEKLINIR